MKSVSAPLALLVIASICAAQSVTSDDVASRPTATDTHRAEVGGPCVFDFERGEVLDCVRENTTGQLSIAVQFLSELPFDVQGLAAVLSHEKGWMYVNRKGNVLVKGTRSCGIVWSGSSYRALRRETPVGIVSLGSGVLDGEFVDGLGWPLLRRAAAQAQANGAALA
jgi:hypothetical protein